MLAHTIARGRARMMSTIASSAVPSSLSEAKALLTKLGGEGRVKLDHDWRKEGQALLTLANPQRANALSCAMMVEFHDKILELEDAKRARAVIFTGEGDNFCAGADLRGHTDFFKPEVGAAMNMVMSDACDRLLNMDAVSVAAVAGTAVGGGAELTTACDFRVLAEDAALQFIQVRRGVTPGWGGARRLLQVLPRNKALWLLASGHRVPAEMGTTIGLVDAVYPLGDDFSVAHAAEEFLDNIIFEAPSRSAASAAAAAGAIAGGGAGDGDASGVTAVAAANARKEDRIASDPVSLRAAKRVVAAITSGRPEAEGEIFCSMWGGHAQMAELQRWSKSRGRKA